MFTIYWFDVTCQGLLLTACFIIPLARVRHFVVIKIKTTTEFGNSDAIL